MRKVTGVFSVTLKEISSKKIATSRVYLNVNWNRSATCTAFNVTKKCSDCEQHFPNWRRYKSSTAAQASVLSSYGNPASYIKAAGVLFMIVFSIVIQRETFLTRLFHLSPVHAPKTEENKDVFTNFPTLSPFWWFEESENEVGMQMSSRGNLLKSGA